MNSHTPRGWFRPFSGSLPRGGRPPRAVRFRRPELEGLERRTVLSVTITPTNNSGQGYAALDFNQSGGYTPPDTNGAAGPSSYVETVNQTVALYGSKATGSPASTSSLSNFWFSTGGLAHADSTSNLSDPIVTFNDQIGRFIVGDQDVDSSTHVSRFDIAVSKTGSPSSLSAADWNFYQIDTTESGFDADYPGNFGYNHDAFVFTLNMFGVTGGGHAMVVAVSNADLAGGVAQSAIHVSRNDVNAFSLRPTVMHDSVAGDPMWLVTEHGDGTSIDVVKDTNVLSNTASFAFTNLAVTPYSGAVPPLNPNGTAITTNLDSRIEKAAERNHVLVASHSVAASSTQDVAQWYAVDVSSGTPTLKDQGRVGAGNNTYVTFPSVDVNASGQVGMTYVKSGNDTSTDYMSMYVTGRDPSDPAGTMEAPVLVPAGAGVANYKDFSSGGRAGDLSGINVDPSDGSFWAANEFANTDASANWGTAVANFTVSSPISPADMSVGLSGPTSVTAGSTASYTLTVTNLGPNAAQGVVLKDVLPAGTTVASLVRTSGTDGFTYSQSGNTATATATAAIAAHATDTFTLVVNVPANLAGGSSYTDTASVSATSPDPSASNNTATFTSSVMNSSTGADLSASVSGPASGNEGDSVTYTITVKNLGPASSAGVTLTDTLSALLYYKTATASQGNFSVSGGVVTFNVGTVAAGATFTATVTAQATEGGSASDSASISATTPDPSTTNNTASATTSFAEPPIVVSGPLTTKSRSFSAQVATFTHAQGVEPAGAFRATINWGDGTTSVGTVNQPGTTYYTVTASHSYSGGGKHTITTTVTEAGNSVSTFGGANGSGSWRKQDAVRLPRDSGNPAGLDQGPALASPEMAPMASASFRLDVFVPGTMPPPSAAGGTGAVASPAPVALSLHTARPGVSPSIAILDLYASPASDRSRAGASLAHDAGSRRLTSFTS